MNELRHAGIGPGRVIATIGTGELERVDVEGAANAATGEPLTAASLFYVGSLAKQFVAACIALLVEDALLTTDDPARRFCPELPDWGDRVTIAHLIHHTGGLPPPPYFLDGLTPEGVPAYDTAHRLARVFAIEELEWEPDSAFRYSNHGYTLLGEIVARASGTSLAAFARERIFVPLGMDETFFRDAPTALPGNAARGHFEAADGRTYVEPARFHAVGAGGLWTTVADLARWDAAAYDPRSVAARLPARGSLTDGTPIDYAWGIAVKEHGNRTIHSHGGTFPGWLAKMVRFPDARLTVVVLANHEAIDATATALRTAEALLGDRSAGGPAG